MNREKRDTAVYRNRCATTPDAKKTSMAGAW